MLAGARCAVSSGLLPRPGAGAGTGAISGERNSREDLLRQGHTIECIHCGKVETTLLTSFVVAQPDTTGIMHATSVTFTIYANIDVTSSNKVESG
jgi:hypothetical protein